MGALHAVFPVFIVHGNVCMKPANKQYRALLSRFASEFLGRSLSRQSIKVNNFFGDFVDGWVVVFKFIYVD